LPPAFIMLKKVIRIFFKKNKKLHLRYVLQVAILIEKEGEQFYVKLAQMSSNGQVKELCAKLAKDEADHRKLFEAELSQWLHLPASQEHLNSYIQELKNKGLFLNLIFLQESVDALVKSAIEYENKTADFYQSLEREFPELWKQMQIHMLVVAERSHANSLKSLV